MSDNNAYLNTSGASSKGLTPFRGFYPHLKERLVKDLFPISHFKLQTSILKGIPIKKFPSFPPLLPLIRIAQASKLRGPA